MRTTRIVAARAEGAQRHIPATGITLGLVPALRCSEATVSH